MSKAADLAKFVSTVLGTGGTPSDARTGLAQPAILTHATVPVGGAVTAIECNGLVPDTLYRGEFLGIANADAAMGWQSRFVSGGAWDVGVSDYVVEHMVAFGGSSAASTYVAASAAFNTIDLQNPGIPGLAQFTLYTGSPSRRAVMVGTFAGITGDGASLITMAMHTERVAFGALADIRFMSATANGLAAGSRVRLERLL